MGHIVGAQVFPERMNSADYGKKQGSFPVEVTSQENFKGQRSGLQVGMGGQRGRASQVGGAACPKT